MCMYVNLCVCACARVLLAVCAKPSLPSDGDKPLLCLCVMRRMLGESYGIPRLHYKGQQDSFYIMVCKLPCKLLAKGLALPRCSCAVTLPWLLTLPAVWRYNSTLEMPRLRALLSS